MPQAQKVSHHHDDDGEVEVCKAQYVDIAAVCARNELCLLFQEGKTPTKAAHGRRVKADAHSSLAPIHKHRAGKMEIIMYFIWGIIYIISGFGVLACASIVLVYVFRVCALPVLLLVVPSC